MAEVRLTPSLPIVSAPSPARTSDAVRAAQRAFFEAALDASASPAPARPAAAPSPAKAAAPAPARLQQAAGEGAAAPSRPLRPGSLLDIRV